MTENNNIPSSQNIICAQQIIRQLSNTSGFPDYILDIVDKKTGVPTGKRYIDYGKYAKFLKTFFNIINFNKQLYIYDKKQHFYKINENEIETHIHETRDKYVVVEKLNTLEREMRVQLLSMGCETKYPFNMSENTIPVKNGVIKINYSAYIDDVSFIRESNFDTIKTPKQTDPFPSGKRYELLPHSPEHLFTFTLPVKYNKNARKCISLRVLKQWLDNKKVWCFVQIPAQALLQIHLELPYKKAYMIQGATNAGKSTGVSLLFGLFGREFCSNADLQRLCEDRFIGGYLEGKLLNIFDDLEDVPLNSVGRFKNLTGLNYGDIQRKGKDTYTGRITAVHVFTCNRPPLFPPRVEEDNAFWERWEYINFQNTFPVNPDMIKRIFSEDFMSSFLNVVLDAMCDITTSGGLLVTSDAQDVMERWIVNSDPVLEFLQWGFGNNVGSAIQKYSKRKMYREYSKFCDENKIPMKKRVLEGKAFTSALQVRGFIPIRVKSKGESHEVYSTTHYKINPSSITDLNWETENENQSL